MHQPPGSLRPQEEVIDEFGVSVKYTILLGIIGSLIIGAGLVIRVAWSEQLELIATQLGVFGPLVVTVAVGAIVLTGAYLIALGLFFRVAYRYYFTTERVIESVGFLSQHTVSAEYKHLTDLIVRQDPISHLVLNTGTLAINTAGGPQEEIVLTNIDNPTARREQLRGLAAAAQNGKQVTRALLKQLKRQTGMADTAAPDVTLTPAPLPEEALTSERSASSMTMSATARGTASGAETTGTIEDLHGDGIDNSDVLRDKQRRLDS